MASLILSECSIFLNLCQARLRWVNNFNSVQTTKNFIRAAQLLSWYIGLEENFILILKNGEGVFIY